MSVLRLSRTRQLLVSVLVIVGLSVAGCAPAVTTSSASGLHVIPAGQLGGEFTSASVPTVERILAADGVATVTNESGGAPLITLTGPVRMTFTLAQVRAMTLEAANHGGTRGATLDSSAPLRAGYPPAAYLLASWVSTATTPGARAIRELMGKQRWTAAPDIVFPTIALTLFAADVLAASPAPASPAPTPSASSSPQAVGPVSQLSGIEQAAFVRAGAFSAPCSTVSNFIQSVLNSVFSALQLGTSSSDGVVSGFFKGIWNGALSLARGAIQGLINAVTGPVVTAIRTIAGAAAVLAQIVSYLNPWSVKVTADPSSVEAGSGGTFTAVVDTGTGGTDYPSSVKDCAKNGLGLDLPPLTAADAKANWTLDGAISTSDQTSVTLDEHSTGTLSFSSKAGPAASCGSSDAADQTGTASITVTRPGADTLKQLATTMLTNGLGVAGSVVGKIVASVLDPIIDNVISKIDALTDVTGSGTVGITAAQAANCNQSSKAAGSSPAASTPPSTRKVAFVCPSVGIVKSLLNDPTLDSVSTLANNPGTLLDCVYVESTGGGSECDNHEMCVAEVVFLDGATDDASNFDSRNHLLDKSLCDCDVDAYNNIPSSGFDAADALTVLGVVNGVQVGVSYGKNRGVEPGLALLREIFSK